MIHSLQRGPRADRCNWRWETPINGLINRFPWVKKNLLLGLKKLHLQLVSDEFQQPFIWEPASCLCNQFFGWESLSLIIDNIYIIYIHEYDILNKCFELICKYKYIYIHIWGISWPLVSIAILPTLRRTKSPFYRFPSRNEVRKDGTCQRRRICSAHAQDHESARCGVSIFYEIHLKNEKEESEQPTKCKKTSF